MKKIALVLICSLALTFLAEAQGIQFVEDKWENVLNLAKEQDKLIFVDAYTTWCGPCKWMSANVFPEESVGAFFNAEFINVKMDMEKGEGLEVAKTYSVRAYPTFLFINGEGELVHKGIGSQPAEKFIELGTAASDPDRQYGSLKTRYEKGDRQTDLIKNYASAAREVGDKSYSEIVMNYLKEQKDWGSPENVAFIYDFIPDDPSAELFEYVASNKKDFYDQIGEKEVDQKLADAILNTKLRDRTATPEGTAEVMRATFEGKKAEKYIALYNMYYYMYNNRSGENTAKFEEAAMNYLGKYLDEVGDNWSLLNSIAWSFYENVDREKSLKAAAKWAERSIEIENNYFNNDTAAAIYYKLGDKQKAIKYAQKAIELAEAAGESPEETKKLLEKINALD